MKRILLIEDDPDQALLTTETLKENLKGAEVTVASSGTAALENDLAAFNVIILDYNLPDMTGLEVLGQITKRPHGPIIMVTGEGDLEIAIQAFKEGADDFIVKSVDLQRLLPHLVEKTLANFEQKKILQEMEIREREKKVQIDTLKRVMITLAHHLNNAVMPITFSAELCKRSDYGTEAAARLVDSCLKETKRINAIIDRFEEYVDSEDFRFADYLDLKDAMFDVQTTLKPEKKRLHHV